MERHLKGITYQFGLGSALVDVIEKDDEAYIRAHRLMDDFGIIVAGNLSTSVEYNVTPLVQWEQSDGTIIVPRGAAEQMSADTIALYAQIGVALKDEKSYVKAFKEKASEGAPKEGKKVTKSSKKEVVEGEKIEKEIVDYMDVVRTLIPVPMSSKAKQWDPELPRLVAESVSLRELQRTMSWYDLAELESRRTRAEPGIYVGIASVSDRISNLIEEKTEKSEVSKAEIKPIF
jgi:hypothetical protein